MDTPDKPQPRPHVYPGGQHFPGPGPETAPPDITGPATPLRPPSGPLTPPPPLRPLRTGPNTQWNWKRIAAVIVGLIIVVQLGSSLLGGKQKTVMPRTGATTRGAGAGEDAAAASVIEGKVLPNILGVSTVRVTARDENGGVFVAEFRRQPRGVYLRRVVNSTATLEKVYTRTGAWGRATVDPGSAAASTASLCWKSALVNTNLNPRDLVPVLNPLGAPRFTSMPVAGTVNVSGHGAGDAGEAYTGQVMFNPVDGTVTGYSARSGGAKSTGAVTYPKTLLFPDPSPKC